MFARALLLLTLATSAAFAQGPPGNSLAIGPGFLIREKAYTGATAEVIPIPWIEAQFGRWSIRGLGAEYALGGRGAVRFSATGTLRLGGVEPEDLEPELDLLDRKPTLELGMSASIPVGRWRLAAQGSADVLGRHGGFDAAVRVTRMFRAGPAIVVPSAGVRYWSADLAAYDYGLEPGEAGFVDGYEPGGAVIPEISIAGTLPLNERWSIVGFGRVLRLDDGIVASPIVDRRTETIAGFGLGYRLRP